MKKIALILCTIITLSTTTAMAHPPHHYHGYHHRYSGCSSSCVYIVRSDYSENESKFENCDDHYLLTKTTVNYYSNGSRRTFNYHTIFNNDGSILMADCTAVKHINYHKQHYFMIRKGGSYKIITSQGQELTTRKYKQMTELEPNRLLVQVDKRYGVIDLHENTIVPIKYKSFEKSPHNIFITKLNGYYGILNSEYKLVLPNEYDKIKTLYDTYLLKKDGDYGLADLSGNILISADKDKIKKLGEYIVVEKDNKYSVYTQNGTPINGIEYRKVKIERNALYGKKYGEKDYSLITQQEI